MALNKVMLIGNVGKDPEIRYLEGNSPNGANTKVATFPLATTEKYRDRNQELHENTEWHNIVAWRSQADIVEKFIKKGSQVYIEGKLRSRSWLDQNNQKRYVTEVVVDSIQLLGRRQENNSQQQGAQTQTSAYSTFATQQQPQQPLGATVQAPRPADDPSVDMPGSTEDLPF